MRKRDKRVVVYFTEEEVNALNRKVELSGLSREGYCRSVLADSQVTAFDADVSILIKELRSISSTLSQIIQEQKTANPGQLQSALNDIQTIKQTIKDAYSF